MFFFEFGCLFINKTVGNKMQQLFDKLDLVFYLTQQNLVDVEWIYGNDKREDSHPNCVRFLKTRNLADHFTVDKIAVFSDHGYVKIVLYLEKFKKFQIHENICPCIWVYILNTLSNMIRNFWQPSHKDRLLNSFTQGCIMCFQWVYCSFTGVIHKSVEKLIL